MTFKIEKSSYETFLSERADESVDLVVTDPPYESLEKHRAIGTTTRLKKSAGSDNKWFPIISNYELIHLTFELYRVLKPKSHCYIFCDDETSDHLKKAAIEAGFYCWKRLVWDKKHIGMGYHYRSRYEFILFLEKGTKKWVPAPDRTFNGTRQLNDRSTPDVLEFPRIKSKEAYPTEKPIGLAEVLILNSSNEGDIVLDPFVGSGSFGAAAVKNGREFIGCDIQDDSIDRATKLLKIFEKAISSK
jgi:site-specific DNA-methyltransferase (adenine-specific)